MDLTLKVTGKNDILAKIDNMKLDYQHAQSIDHPPHRTECPGVEFCRVTGNRIDNALEALEMQAKDRR